MSIQKSEDSAAAFHLEYNAINKLIDTTLHSSTETKIYFNLLHVNSLNSLSEHIQVVTQKIFFC